MHGWLTDWRIRTSFKTDVELKIFFHIKRPLMKVLVTENCAGLLLIRIKLEQNLVPPLNVVAVVFLQMILMATLAGKKNKWDSRAM